MVTVTMSITIMAQPHDFHQREGVDVTFDAMVVAIESYKIPTRQKHVRRSQLPNNMLEVIKAAAGDSETISRWAMSYKMRDDELQEAAKHYLLRLLLAPDTSGLRLLGLQEGALPDEVKSHKRWLLKWLHPDRNPNQWERSLFLKVNAVAIPTEGSVLETQLPVKVSRRDGAKTQSKRGWTASEKRIPQASPWSIALRIASVILICAIASWLILGLIASSENTSPGFIRWFK
jgi:hypothetical protein